jgi:hypothetical protein
LLVGRAGRAPSIPDLVIAALELADLPCCASIRAFRLVAEIPGQPVGAGTSGDLDRPAR